MYRICSRCTWRLAAMKKFFAHQRILKSHTPTNYKLALDNMKSVQSEKGFGSFTHVRRQLG